MPQKTLENLYFSEQIITWYQKHKRNLPWRKTTNPYFIWLSEIILQQTRVIQGLPYFEKFINEYPTIFDLANASEQEVLRLWQGLGYYTRARNLHACAKILVDKYKGNFPETYHELVNLKGIGEYTAAAIASFAYNETVPVVDGNVYRVLSRVFGIKHDIATNQGKKNFRKLAEKLVPEGQAYIYNQAIMEFGALQCTPVAPACLVCPLQGNCYAFQHGMQYELPVKTRKIKPRNRYFHYFVIHYKDEFVMQLRTADDIWKGLYEFYLKENDTAFMPFSALIEGVIGEILLESHAIKVSESKIYKHQLTHQRLFVKFYVVNINSEIFMQSIKESCKFATFSLETIKKLPKSILIDKFLNERFF